MPVTVTAVTATHQRTDQRTTYLVTLSCGCRYWADRETGTATPIVGGANKCYASHDGPPSKPDQ